MEWRVIVVTDAADRIRELYNDDTRSLSGTGRQLIAYVGTEEEAASVLETLSSTIRANGAAVESASVEWWDEDSSNWLAPGELRAKAGSRSDSMLGALLEGVFDGPWP